MEDNDIKTGGIKLELDITNSEFVFGLTIMKQVFDKINIL